MNKLWTKNFKLITISTVFAAIAGEAINLPISLVVFDETGSTLMVAFVFVLSLLPDVLLSVLIAPMIERGSKKKWMIIMDILLIVVYVFMSYYTHYHQFNYLAYSLFSFIVGIISMIHSISYQAIYPELIEVGHEQKGYAVSSVLYPTIIMIMAPITTFLYVEISMSMMFVTVAILSGFSVIFIYMMEEVKVESEPYTFKMYRQDLKDGFEYLNNKIGLRNIYMFDGLSSGTNEAMQVLINAFFQTSSVVSVSMLGFIRSAEMIGRLVGGVINYNIQLEPNKRYAFIKIVYYFYDFCNAILLYIPFIGMVTNRFICGGLGTATGTIKQAAVQSYIPSEMRARVAAISNMMIMCGIAIFSLFGGLIGEFIPFQLGVLLFSMFDMLLITFLIVLPKKHNKDVFCAIRVEGESNG